FCGIAIMVTRDSDRLNDSAMKSCAQAFVEKAVGLMREAADDNEKILINTELIKVYSHLGLEEEKNNAKDRILWLLDRDQNISNETRIAVGKNLFTIDNDLVRTCFCVMSVWDRE